MFAIRNCPAYGEPYCYDDNSDKTEGCGAKDYCLLKQIYRMCADESLNCEENIPCEECEYYGMCSSEFANRILKKMDIEILEIS